MLCILAGLTSITTGRFVILLLAARPWGLLVASALGGSALEFPFWAMAVLGVGGVVLFVLCMHHAERLEEAVLGRLRRK